jgi:hypothetical protein
LFYGLFQYPNKKYIGQNDEKKEMEDLKKIPPTAEET